MPNSFLILIPLRSYELVTNTNDLFDVFEKLGCPVPGMKEYAQQNNGEGLVLILDGWDELPNQLQTESLFSDIVFSKNSVFLYSTIIVTSRPSCSEKIAKAVQQRKAHYQILGFSPHNSELYIKHYFSNDLQLAELLISMLKGQEYLLRDFYIPITVAIMCFVYSHSDEGEIPETLSRLYEHFVVLCVRSNIPNTSPQDLAKFKTIHNIPGTIKPAFHKLCKMAFDKLKDNKLVLNQEVMQDELDNLQQKQFDGFGLLHVDHYTTAVATMETSYSFIHRAVQELLAAIFILDTGNISDILDEHFYEGSYLMNVFPFLFGLVSKELLRPLDLAGKLKQIFYKSDRNCDLLSSILYCLFEAHDETLCREFGQVFSEKREISVDLYTLLNCHYACYFITVCGVEQLNVTIICFISSHDLCCEIFAKYLQNASTDIASFRFSVYKGELSHKGMEHFAKALSTQPNILSVVLHANCCEPGCVSILCNNICKHNTQITKLELSMDKMTENELESIGSPLRTLSLETLYLSSCCGIVYLDSLPLFCKALYETKSLHNLHFQMMLSQADSKVFGDIISQNCSLKTLRVEVATADCLDPILNGLSSNTSITTFRVWPDKTGASNTLGQCLEKCLTFNHSLNIVDFTPSHFTPFPKYVSWSSTQVCSICTGLRANTTVVTLDISGCYIDTEACHAVCGMLSQNTTLQHLFLNPVQLDKQEAITMIESCRDNDTLELLSLVQWPPKIFMDDDGIDVFQYSCDPKINNVLLNIQKFRRGKLQPLLNVYWLVSFHCIGVVI